MFCMPIWMMTVFLFTVLMLLFIGHKNVLALYDLVNVCLYCSWLSPNRLIKTEDYFITSISCSVTGFITVRAKTRAKQLKHYSIKLLQCSFEWFELCHFWVQHKPHLHEKYTCNKNTVFHCPLIGYKSQKISKFNDVKGKNDRFGPLQNTISSLNKLNCGSLSIKLAPLKKD